VTQPVELPFPRIFFAKTVNSLFKGITQQFMSLMHICIEVVIVVAAVGDDKFSLLICLIEVQFD